MCVLVSRSQMAILFRLNFHKESEQNGGLATQDMVCTHNICRKSIVDCIYLCATRTELSQV